MIVTYAYPMSEADSAAAVAMWANVPGVEVQFCQDLTQAAAAVAALIVRPSDARAIGSIPAMLNALTEIYWRHAFASEPNGRDAATAQAAAAAILAATGLNPEKGKTR
jgi:hypothetical protein